MSTELINTIATVAGVIVAILGAFLFAFWIAMGIWTFNDIRSRSRDWLAILLACTLVLIFPVVGLILYMMIRPKDSLADVYDRALEEEALLRELEGTLTCHSCGVPVKENWVYCPNCHTQQQHSCPNCANLVRNDWEICVHCGVDQRGIDPRGVEQRIPNPRSVNQRPDPMPNRAPARGGNPFGRNPRAPGAGDGRDESIYQPAQPME